VAAQFRFSAYFLLRDRLAIVLRVEVKAFAMLLVVLPARRQSLSAAIWELAVYD
jgi:hypothetical protein